MIVPITWVMAGILAGGIGVEQFEIVRRRGDAGAAHQSERRLGKGLFAVLLEHFHCPRSPGSVWLRRYVKSVKWRGISTPKVQKNRRVCAGRA